MNIAYANYFGPLTRGSCYKYWTVLHRLYGGTFYDGDEENAASTDKINAQIEQNEPDIMFIPGGQWTFWETCHDLGIPYVLEHHDVMSWLGHDLKKHEREMVEGAEAVIFTSEEHVAWHRKLRHRLPPHEVIHLRPLRADLDFVPLPKLPGKTLVYVGGVNSWLRRETQFGYRTYHYIFSSFIACGWDVHVYTPFRGRESDYAKIGVICHTPAAQADLYREMSQYTAGFHGYNVIGVPASAVDYCMGCRPNKTWEYLAAGIPTIGVNSGNSGNLFGGKWGLVCPPQSDLLTWIKGVEHRLPVITDEMRFAETIEQDIPKLKALLDPILL
jgi:hypothetical protein